MGQLGRFGDTLLPCRLLLGPHPSEIATGAEALAGAGEDDGADGGIGANLGRDGGEIGNHRGVHGVVLVGPIERQRGDAAVIAGD